MPYVSLYEHLPMLAMNETRTISVLTDSNSLPRGDYMLVEMYCDEPDCDCRRVIFTVKPSFSKQPVAVIAYGWEDRDFYARWYHHDKDGSKGVTYNDLSKTDKSDIDEIKGPCLNSFSQQSKYASEILSLVTEKILTDEMYVERLKRHYMVFKRKVRRIKKRR